MERARTARNVAIVALIAAAVFVLPGGGRAANTFEAVLVVGFGAGIAYLGLRLYRENRVALYSLGDRVVDCFLRSENATSASEDYLPTPSSEEVLAVSAYITWLARGYEVGKNPMWRGQNTIAASNLIPVEKLDARKGEALFNG